MSEIDFVLLTVGLTGAAIVWLLFTKRFSWNMTRFYGMPSKQVAAAVPFWLALAVLLSFAAIVFSAHAFYVVYGLLP